MAKMAKENQPNLFSNLISKCTDNSSCRQNANSWVIPGQLQFVNWLVILHGFYTIRVDYN